MRILIFVLLFIAGCFEGREPGKVHDATGRFDQICIEGHVYWYRSDGIAQSSTEVMASRLTDEGKPVKCTVTK